MLTLDTDRLHITLADPESLIDQTRFDHTAFITEVVLDGKQRLCGSEPSSINGRSSGGRGLCSEFLLLDPAGPVSGRMIKPGVGLLDIPKETPYDPFQAYSFTGPDVRIEKGPGMVSFWTAPIELEEYALQICRTIIAVGNVLTLETLATNPGKRPVAFLEYCHNFFRIWGTPGGMRGIELLDMKELNNGIYTNDQALKISRWEGRTLWLTQPAKRPARFSLGAEHIAGIAEDFAWRIWNGEAQIEGHACFRPEKVAVWTKGEVLCPEVFYQCSLQPGEYRTWKRQWIFG